MKHKIVSDTLDMLLGKGEDTVDVTEQLAEQTELKREADALEASFDGTTKRLAEFKLTPRTLKLLDAACVNVASNMGSNSMDAPTQKQIQERAALFAACDNDLVTVIDTIYGAIVTEAGNAAQVKSAASSIYSTCFAVQKAANFVANLWYRRALDPIADDDLAGPNRKVDGTVLRDDGQVFHADRRQEDRGCIPGLGPDGEELTVVGNAVEHDGIGDEWTDPVQNVVDAYVELHDYLQLLTESFGWDPDRAMPFLFVMRKDGGFDPITDPTAALDVMEVKSKQSRAKRQIAQTAALAAAIAARRKVLRKMAQK